MSASIVVRNAPTFIVYPGSPMIEPSAVWGAARVGKSRRPAALSLKSVPSDSRSPLKS
jgi:hypothetical protein